MESDFTDTVRQMPETRCVVFDLGNVLIEWDRRLLFEKLITDGEQLQDFLDNVFTMEDNRILDSGTPVHEVAAAVALRHPDKRDLVTAFADRWSETLGDVIEGTVEILGDLHSAGVPVYALSNWGRDTFAMIEPNYPFLQLFDGMVISGREGVTKPDAAIFQILCDRYDILPQNAVFIDDSSANVAAAMIMGFDALLFERADRLRQQLVERSLL
ncbi:MAG: 2-haloacid dehalogenase [Verrucomicrobiales bacterium]|jgi:2-haloacid dehalogenase